MTLHEALLYGEQVLSENYVEQPDWNAEQLLFLALRESRSLVYADLKRELTEAEMDTYRKLLQKRARHYPLAYLEGTQEFFGREFRVNESVLIPRPETEEIVRLVLGLRLPQRPALLDLGAGSGILCVTLAHELPGSVVVGLEISPEALAVLRINSNELIRIIRADFRSLPFAPERFDVVVSNPPYVERHEFRDLPAETVWEPRMALLVEFLEENYRVLLEQSVRVLKRGGYLVFEIGFGQSDRIQAVCEKVQGLRLQEIRNDQRSVPRVFLLQKNR